MEKYIIDGNEYTLEEIQYLANKKGYTVDQLLQKNPNIKPLNVGKQTGVAKTAVAVAQKI